MDTIIWKKCKNYLSLSIKQLSINKESFQNLLLVTFISALLIFPSVIVPRSINQQNISEAELSTGCADLVIENWDNSNYVMLSKIETLSSVVHTSQVTQTIAYYFDENLVGDDYFVVYLLSIDNSTDFLDTTQISLLDKYSINPFVIDSLVNNGSVLCNIDFAQKRNLLINENFTSIGFTSSSNLVNLTLLDTFSSFPLIPLYREIPNQSVFSEVFAFVGNNYTIASIIDAFIPQTEYYQENLLLIDVISSAKITSLKKELENLGLSVRTATDSQSILDKQINRFSLNVLLIGLLLLVISLFLVGNLTAKEIYQKRLFLLETYYRIGSKRSFIWNIFSLELLLLIIPVIAFSFSLFLPLMRILILNFLQIQQEYLTFTLWLPWWLILIGLFSTFLFIFTGWFSGLIPLVKDYQPTKQE